MKSCNNGTKATLFISGITLILTLVGAVFFALSYQTGYVGIIYGEKNSGVITIEVVVVIAVNAYLVLSQWKGRWRNGLVYEILTYILVVAITTMTLFLLVDRVDAIGNCIVAPWDAGHGGEDSCYLSFVSMGCWGVCLLADLVLGFTGYNRRRPIVIEHDAGDGAVL